MPITVFYGLKDKKIKREMVEGWQKFTTGAFRLKEIDGHHLWPLQPASKTNWLQEIVDDLPV